MHVRGLVMIVVLAGGLPACKPRVIDVSGESTSTDAVETADVPTSEPTTDGTTGEPCDPKGKAEQESEDGEPCKSGFECKAVPGNPDVFVCQKPKK